LHWFAAHLHVRFTAVVHHNKDDEEKGTKTDEIKSSINSSRVTNFLALDKPMANENRRRFLEYIDIPISEGLLIFKIKLFTFFSFRFFYGIVL